MWLELGGVWFNTDGIAAVKPAGLVKGKQASIIYTIGQSAVDGGFLVNVSVSKVVERLKQARFTEMVDMLDEAEAQQGETEEPPEESEEQEEEEEATDQGRNR